MVFWARGRILMKPTPNGLPYWEKIFTKILDPQRDYFREEGLKCVFKLYFLVVRQMQLKI